MQKLPREFKRIHLELAREKGHPEGSRAVSYDLVAPLDEEGRIDATLWHAHKDACRVVRSRPNQDPVTGYLRRRPGGSWAFHYQLDGREDDDPGYRFEQHRFVAGEYVTLIEDDGQHPYRVVAVDPLPSASAAAQREVR
jgi:hypothetical protein